MSRNQPTLFTTLDALPWNDVPISHTQADRGHGRIQRRTIRVLPAPHDLPFPHVNQVTLIERYVADLAGNPTSAVASPASPPPALTQHTLANLARNHWRIESRHCHHPHPVGPRVMAGLRNLAIGSIRLIGHTDITETTRWASRFIHRPFQILGLTT